MRRGLQTWGLLVILCSATAAQGLSWGKSAPETTPVHDIGVTLHTLIEELGLASYDGGWILVDMASVPPKLSFTKNACGGEDAKSFDVPVFGFDLIPSDSRPVPAGITDTNGAGIALNEVYFDPTHPDYMGMSAAAQAGTVIHELAHVVFEQHVADNGEAACQTCIGNEWPAGPSCSEAYAYGEQSAQMCELANATDSSGQYVLDTAMRDAYQHNANWARSQCVLEQGACAQKSGQCACSLTPPCSEHEGCPPTCSLD